MIGQADNLGALAAVLPANISHLSEGRKELVRRVAPCLSAPGHSKITAPPLPDGHFLNENGGRFVCRVGHLYALLQARPGAEQSAVTQINFKPDNPLISTNGWAA
jgi:hypothetical protein